MSECYYTGHSLDMSNGVKWLFTVEPERRGFMQRQKTARVGDCSALPTHLACFNMKPVCRALHGSLRHLLWKTCLNVFNRLGMRT